MRIIAIGDIHMSAEHIYRLDNVEGADLVVVNGDLTNYGSRQEAKQVLDTLMSANPHVLAQFGNLDHPEINDYLEDLGLNLHNQARMIHNRVCLIGIGGSNSTPFETPSEFSETQLASFAENGHKQALEYISLAEPIEKIKIPLILVSHTPPVGTAVDKLSDGSHVGSSAIREFIERNQPDLCIAGHIHEAKGQDVLGSTPVFNPGMFRRGGWLEITIKKSELKTTLHD